MTKFVWKSCILLFLFDLSPNMRSLYRSKHLILKINDSISKNIF